MIQLPCGKLTIEVLDASGYSSGSADNARRYEREYLLDDGEYTPSSQHAVHVLSDDRETEIASCILNASGGASGIHDHSALVDDDSLILAVGPFMVSLKLPTLDLRWKSRTDAATCFGVYHSINHHCYISHGELSVARISYAGVIEWSQGGADIFTNGFVVTDDGVEAIDWNNDLYVWEIDTGRLLRSKGINQTGNHPS